MDQNVFDTHNSYYKKYGFMPSQQGSLLRSWLLAFSCLKFIHMYECAHACALTCTLTHTSYAVETYSCLACLCSPLSDFYAGISERGKLCELLLQLLEWLLGFSNPQNGFLYPSLRLMDRPGKWLSQEFLLQKPTNLSSRSTLIMGSQPR